MKKAIQSDNLVERHQIEETFHDRKAVEAPQDFYGFGALDAADRYLWDSLGDLKGKQLLEIGCGDGKATLQFARHGAHVIALDISGEMVELTRRKAAEAGLATSVQALHVGGENFDLPASSVDIVYGHSVLHHLNLDVATARITAVLRPGGVAAFLEPLAYNPLVNFFRVLTPQRRTPTERPLTFDQLKTFGASFSSWDHREFYLFSLVSFAWYYGIRNKRLFEGTHRTLQPLDTAAFRLFPFLRKYAWLTVATFHK